MESHTVNITVLFNNVPKDPRLQPAHGMSCLIEGLPKTVLFDTGGDGEILLDNMAHLGKDPAAVDIVVISHAHWDHSGGLFTFLHKARRGIDVFLPKGVSKVFREHTALLGAKVHVVEESVEVTGGLRSTGQLGDDDLPDPMKEQAIILDTVEGPVVITGCAHPDILDIVKTSIDLVRGKIHCVLGGFHLHEKSDDEVDALIANLKELGINRMGPSHCTGGKQMQAFRAAWGADYVEFGCGTTLSFQVTA